MLCVFNAKNIKMEIGEGIAFPFTVFEALSVQLTLTACCLDPPVLNLAGTGLPPVGIHDLARPH